MTPSPAPSAAPNAADDGPRVGFAALMIFLAAVAVYAPSLAGPFIFDDFNAIRDNPTIRSLWPPGPVLAPPHAQGATVGGRPVLNVSFAINHAISGADTWSYHLGNLFIHALAGMTLCALLRRALGAAGFTGARAEPIAFFTALLWTLHPLQTESVSYIAQRAESLCGLFYLFTTYAFLRSSASSRPRAWLAVSVVACLLGGATKEVAATAPLFVLLLDRALVAGSLRAALRARGAYYAALALSWIAVAVLVASTSGRGGTAGLGAGVTPWAYLWSQPLALTRYLGLAAWPFPLMLDHGGTLAYAGALDAIARGLAVLALLGAAALALVRWPRAGLAGAWFFLILAPSSSVVPLLDTMFEHRMYLALAAPLLLFTQGASAVLGAHARVVFVTLAVFTGALAAARNVTYRSDTDLWLDNIAHTPANPRPHFELGNALLAQGRAADAAERYRAAVALRPDYVEAHHNLGAALMRAGRVMDAIVAFGKSNDLHPRADTFFLLAGCQVQIGRVDDAIASYDAAIRLAPAHVDALNNRGNLRIQKGAPAAALADYEAALRHNPAHVDAHLNAAVALLALHRPAEAVTHCEAALKLRPDYGAAHWKFGDTLLELNQPGPAAESYRRAVALDSSLLYAHANLGRALAALGRMPEALQAYENALKLAPEWPQTLHNYALALEASGRDREAVTQNARALRLQPDFPEAIRQRDRLQARGVRP